MKMEIPRRIGVNSGVEKMVVRNLYYPKKAESILVIKFTTGRHYLLVTIIILTFRLANHHHS
tara:strand:- start:180 stop:365 length:186 start_codon:yes stop_codon:yes gene_type:complete